MAIDVATLTIGAAANVRAAMRQLDERACGVLLLVDEAGALLRTITDGDLRRALLANDDMGQSLASLQRVEPVVGGQALTAMDALSMMNKHGIDHLPVVDDQGVPLLLHSRAELTSKIYLSTPHLAGSEMHYVQEAFETNWIAPLGPNVDAFEKELAAKVGVADAAALSSGTAAIHLALHMLGVGRGDTVICPSLTFVASANPILYTGAEPYFIDSDASTWNMSPALLERALETCRREKRNVKAVVVVNLYGQSADMTPIMEICDRFGVPVVEDAAESLGATYQGRHSGTFGHIGIYSFNGNKIITTSGGGMLVSDDVELVARARYLASQARRNELHYEHTEVGFNYRMSNVLAGIGRGQIAVLEERVDARRHVFERYQSALAGIDCIRWMPEAPFGRANRWLTTLELVDAPVGGRELMRRLLEHNIEARPIWKPMHLQPLYADAPYLFDADKGSFADRIFEQGLCLPSGSNLSDEQQDQVIDVLRKELQAC
ncbi:MAG: aminotransferase class I/II-fold pyridoxal phosphate-dependent enzyme [Gammaproteobacteria bacterium]